MALLKSLLLVLPGCNDENSGLTFNVLIISEFVCCCCCGRKFVGFVTVVLYTKFVVLGVT